MKYNNKHPSLPNLFRHMKFRTFLLPLFAVPAILAITGGCAGQGSGINPVTWEDYRKEFPASVKHRLEGRKRLSLREAQDIALENNPDYRAAAYSIRAAKAAYCRSLGAYLPRIDWDVTLSQTGTRNRHRIHTPDDVYPGEWKFSPGTTLTASWLLFDGLDREFSILIERQKFIREKALDENTRRLLLRAVAYAYYDALLANQAAGIARSNMAFQMSSLIQAEERYRAGHISKGPVLNFKILADRARSDFQNACCRRDMIRFSLAALMGFSTGELPENLELDPEKIMPEHPPRETEYYIRKAILNRPDLKAIKALWIVSRLRRKQTWSHFLPSVSLFAQGAFGRNQSSVRHSEHHSSSWNSASFRYGLTAHWNLFEGFSDLLLLRENLALEWSSKLTLENTFLQMVCDVKSACCAYENAWRQTAIYREMLSFVFEQRSLVAAGYWAGNNTITRLNEAQSDLVNAELQFATSLAQLGKAEAQLRAAVNLPLELLPLRDIPPPAAGTPLESLLEHLEKQFR